MSSWGSKRPEKEPVALSQWRTGGSPGPRSGRYEVSAVEGPHSAGSFISETVSLGKLFYPPFLSFKFSLNTSTFLPPIVIFVYRRYSGEIVVFHFVTIRVRQFPHPQRMISLDFAGFRVYERRRRLMSAFLTPFPCGSKPPMSYWIIRTLSES